MQAAPGRALAWATLAALMTAAPGALRAESTPAPLPGTSSPSPYPVAVSLTLSPKTLGAEFVHEGSGWMSSPPNPACTVRVGEQARDAYSHAVGRMFREGTQRAADLEVSIVRADVEWDADGWQAVVEDSVVFRGDDAVEIARWKVAGHERIVGLGELAIPRAFAEAAEQAAQKFELSFASPPSVAAWLHQRGIEPQSSVRPASPAPPTLSPFGIPKGPDRGRLVIYLDGGVGLAPSSASFNILDSRVSPAQLTSHTSESTDFAGAARIGLSGRWAFLQIAASRWGSKIENDSVTATVTTLGGDAGLLLRFASDFELMAGGGAYWITANTSVPSYLPGASQSTSRIVPSAFAALRFARAVSAGGARIRLSAEFRHYFDATMTFEYNDPVPNRRTWRELELGSSIALLMGFEFPIIRR